MTETCNNKAYYPVINMETINNYYQKNSQCSKKKMRISGKKNKDAVSSVRIYRNKKNICIVKANINISYSLFRVEVKINEKYSTIFMSKCNTCNNETGCKHVTALLFWLLHTSSTNKTEQHAESKCSASNKNNEQQYRKINNNRYAQNYNSQLNTYSIKNTLPSLNLYTLAVHYKNQFGNVESVDEFINYCKYNFDEDSIEQTTFSTTGQANNAEWHEMRYGRITASKIYEAAYCRTLKGSLFKAVMGQVHFKKKAVDKGHQLEEKVLRVLENKLKTKISRVGLYLNKDYPIFGASPDGITPDYCIEIKCPKKRKSIKKYVNFKNVISSKVMAQLQMQMLFCNRRRGLFCLADPDFEYNNHVDIIEVHYDDYFIKDLMIKAQEYWEYAIFPVLMQN